MITNSYPTLYLWKKYFGEDFFPDAQSIGIGTGVFQSNSNNPLPMHPAKNLKKHPILCNFFSSFYVAGADLSVLLEDSDVKWNGKTIVILAQDPLRDISYYQNSPSSLGKDIAISLPFGVQASLPNQGCQVVVGVINHLLEGGYKVFITDINKFYAKDKSGKKISVSKKLRSLFDIVLQEEIQAVGATKIWAMGNSANDAVKRLKNSLCIFSSPHVSGSANGTWKKKYGFSSVQDKINYICNHI